MPSQLIEKRKEFESKQKKLHEIFEQAKTGGKDLDLEKVTVLKGTTDEKAQEIRKMNEELDRLGKEIETFVELEKADKADQERQKLLNEKDHVPFPDQKGKEKSFGQKCIESGVFKLKNAVKHIDVETKTLFQRSAGWEPESTRSGMVIDYATRPIEVIDMLPQGNTNQAAYKFMEETTFTDNAAEVAEAGSYGEAALALTERSQTVEKIAVFIPVTDEQLEDEAGVASYLDQRLVFMIRRRVGYQCINGDGVTPNLLGFLNKVGIQTQAKGADPTPDAFYKAMTLIRVTGQAEPTAIIIHPNDWQSIRLLRTTDGIYIWGNPSESGVERLWGLPIIQAQAETENTGLVGAFAPYSMFFTRRGVDVQVTNSHDDYFIKGKQCIRADMRGVLVIYRAAAFCTVTGI